MPAVDLLTYQHIIQPGQPLRVCWMFARKPSATVKMSPEHFLAIARNVILAQTGSLNMLQRHLCRAVHMLACPEGIHPMHAQVQHLTTNSKYAGDQCLQSMRAETRWLALAKIISRLNGRQQCPNQPDLATNFLSRTVRCGCANPGQRSGTATAARRLKLNNSHTHTQLNKFDEEQACLSQRLRGAKQLRKLSANVNKRLRHTPCIQHCRTGG